MAPMPFIPGKQILDVTPLIAFLSRFWDGCSTFSCKKRSDNFQAFYMSRLKQLI